MSSSIDIKRITSSSYSIGFSDNKHKPLLIEFRRGEVFSSIDENHEFFYNLAYQIGMDIAENNNPQSYQLGDRTWMVWTQKKNTSTLNQVTNCIHPQGDDGVERIIVTRSEHPSLIFAYQDDTTAFSQQLELKRSVDNAYNQQELREFNKNFRERHEKSKGQSMPRLLPRSPVEREVGIEAKQVCGHMTHRKILTSSFFDSPFTQLSALAFQRYETEFQGGDYFSPNDCQNCLQLHEGVLYLVRQSEEAAKLKEINRATLLLFKEQIIAEYGKEKFDYICHLYRMNFDELLRKGQPLTPEHVYRMNMGLNNLESSDIEHCLSHLSEVRVHASQALIDGSDDMDLIEFFAQLTPNALTIREQRGVLRALQKRHGKETITVKKFLIWSYPFRMYNHIDEMPPKKLDQLMDVFALSQEEYQCIFTGKEIYFDWQENDSC